MAWSNLVLCGVGWSVIVWSRLAWFGVVAGAAYVLSGLIATQHRQEFGYSHHCLPPAFGHGVAFSVRA